jgi:hypothetical protein
MVERKNMRVARHRKSNEAGLGAGAAAADACATRQTSSAAQVHAVNMHTLHCGCSTHREETDVPVMHSQELRQV